MGSREHRRRLRQKRALRKERKMRIAVAVLLEVEFRKQCCGVPWSDAALGGAMMARHLKVERQYQELLSTFPRVRMQVEE